MRSLRNKVGRSYGLRFYHDLGKYYLSESGLKKHVAPEVINGAKVLPLNDLIKAKKLFDLVANYESPNELGLFIDSMAKLPEFHRYAYNFHSDVFGYNTFMNLATAAIFYERDAIFYNVHEHAPQMAFENFTNAEYIVNLKKLPLEFDTPKIFLFNGFNAALQTENLPIVKTLLANEDSVRHNYRSILQGYRATVDTYEITTLSGEEMSKNRQEILNIVKSILNDHAACVR